MMLPENAWDSLVRSARRYNVNSSPSAAEEMAGLILSLHENRPDAEREGWRQLASRKTEAKAAASRENGRKGGRPRKVIEASHDGPACAYCGVSNAQVYVPLQDVHGDPVWHEVTGVQLFQCEQCADIASAAKAVLENSDGTIMRGALAMPRTLTCIVCDGTSDPFLDPKAFHEAHPGEWTTVRHGSNTPVACHTNCTTHGATHSR